ncbi:inositol-3-phosphate synthase [Streptomyces cocklensis]|uniref:Myo-inositol-1-phosphate synthase n=1 Tax=Actinacidiphila cocklensis TaxID=887465 RepID=A0A9W4E105_9ACTN|nr:inositol-3-phosphate synthase [Actinacidiphila cocklensis]MDD1061929.1 inositol-3-phosphate synthase [Actinacidiphila cocklensis]CAG6391280.1 Myo-inositol-1-phosphate synthase [Actinacidiphila cocklensis]
MGSATAHGPRLGVWIIGARGSVATTVVVGAAAVAAGLAPPVGCVTELPDFRAAGLTPVGDLVFGGCDITGVPLAKRAEQLVAAGVLPADLPVAVGKALAAADREIRPGVGVAAGSQAPQAAAIAGQLADFRERHGLDCVVVVNLSSTAPQPAPHPAFADLAALRTALAGPDPVLPPHALYAYAALGSGCGYVDFTPSGAMRLPALDELARSIGVPYTGNDGKTGETLVRSALAPMFAHRALRVRAWSGTNLLGGGDGATLADPSAAASKTASKARSLAELLPDPVEGEVHIDEVPSLGDWKTAWDHIAFDGFLGVRMTMQFTWQGCDSALAAPLVLDLVRLMGRAMACGASGVQPQFAFFFKDPMGATDHRLTPQYDHLRTWAATAAAKG